MRKAFITGITGQDGSYLTELLLEKGYEVHGLVRNQSRPDQHAGRGSGHPILHEGNLASEAALARLIDEIGPAEIYHLAAQSHAGESFAIPEETCDVNTLGSLRLLEAVRKNGANVRLYQASSSEMFGNTRDPVHENSPFQPRTPYAASKVCAHQLAGIYRASYGLHVSCGILFNHESPHRPANYVSRKITRAAAAIKMGLQDKLYLGNLDARRDWGYAPEYVKAMWLMLQQDEPDDYVIATGQTHSIREFVAEAFRHVALDWEQHVIVDPQLFRPADIDGVTGDACRARERLGWSAQVTFEELVRIMVDADLSALHNEPEA
jgi:GDPmannose 4,6-dehydratase